MLSTDYYDILGITRSASEYDIKEAYRRHALRYHPAKCTPEENAESVFNDSGEAYQILIDKRLRALYDQYGRRGLGKAQWIDKNHSGEPPYQEDPKYDHVELKSATVVFEEFFATANPFAASLTRNENTDLNKKRHTQPPIQKYFYCTLEEIYHGCEKTVTLFRKTKEGENESRKLLISVEKGWESGMSVEFKGAGFETENLLPVDVKYTMKECPHPRFLRNQYDLIYTHNISLKNALCGETVHVLTLDERILSIPINYVVTPESSHIVKNEGMPKRGASEEYGNLIIKFNMIFPNEINESTKKILTSLEI